MNRQKKFVLSVLSAAVLVSAGYVGYREVTNDESSDLLLANVEALASGESSYTSWACDGSTPNDCSVQCLKCGVKINSTGVLTGEHRH